MEAWVADIGNTRTRIARFSGSEIQAFLEVNSLEAWLEQKPEKLPLLISNVSNKQLDFLADWENCWHLDQNLKLPFENRYKTPQTLGADRKALVAAAQVYFPGENCLVVDAGTCVTYDLLLNGQFYEGGAISPGLNMRLQAMHEFTGRLPLADPKQEMVWPGKSTQESLLAGALMGLALEIDGFYQTTLEKTGTLQLLLTGGDSSMLSKQVKSPLFAHSQLIMYGLYQILKFNVGQKA